MSHSHAKRKRRNYTWCAVLFALVGTACMLFGIIRLLWPEITEPADLPDHSQPYSAPASEPGKIRLSAVPREGKPPAVIRPLLP